MIIFKKHDKSPIEARNELDDKIYEYLRKNAKNDIKTANNSEIWKDIPNYEGLYQASNLGRIKSIERKIKCNGKNQHCDFKCEKYRKEKILKSKLTKDGYYEAELCKNGRKKYVRVHRLIAETFISNPNSKAKSIIQMDLDGKFIKEWECMSDVQNELGIAVSNISACCKGKYKQTNGYKWKYKEVE